MINRMTTQPKAQTVIVGVDTHKQVHVAVAIATCGMRLAADVQRRERLGGLLNFYHREAA